jgi:hypothetical protein
MLRRGTWEMCLRVRGAILVVRRRKSRSLPLPKACVTYDGWMDDGMTSSMILLSMGYQELTTRR